jgi:hypothetical protein
MAIYKRNSNSLWNFYILLVSYQRKFAFAASSSVARLPLGIAAVAFQKYLFIFYFVVSFCWEYFLGSFTAEIVLGMKNILPTKKDSIITTEIEI